VYADALYSYVLINARNDAVDLKGVVATVVPFLEMKTVPPSIKIDRRSPLTYG
jgi:hypothetical protein